MQAAGRCAFIARHPPDDSRALEKKMQKPGQRSHHKDQRGDKDGFRSNLPRPDTSSQRRDIAAHEKEIVSLKKEASELKSKQEKIRNERSHSRKEFDEARGAMNKLIEQKKAIQSEKNTILASKEASIKKIQASQEKEKQAKSSIKFSSIDAIDNQIKELENRQSRTSMSLSEEKNLVKEIKALNLSKKNFSTLAEFRAETDKEKAKKAEIDKAFSKKNAELKEINQKLDAQKAVLDKLNKSSSETGKLYPEHKKRIEELNSLIDAEYSKIKALRAIIKEKEDAHAAAVAEEKKKHKEEQEELKKQREAEELARHPYEEEMYVCDFLINYLSTKFPTDSSKVDQTSQSNDPKSDVIDAFAGMKSLKRDEYESFMSGVATKKKGKKKKGGQNSKEDITHTHESLAHFSSVGVAPPSKLSSVPDCLKQLEEKKEYFNNLERGAIPSLKQVRVKEESSKSSSKKSNEKVSKQSVFNMESTAEYPEL